jgi:membrane associated rhomboid family serine protease
VKPFALTIPNWKVCLMIDGILMIALAVIVVIGILCTVIPIGNERSTVRRLPWVTFSIMAVNAVVFFATLPLVVSQDEAVTHARAGVLTFLEDYPEITNDKSMREQLLAQGFITQKFADDTEKSLSLDANASREYELYFNGAGSDRIRTAFDGYITDYQSATASSLKYQLGFAPNGQWKLHQLITSAFMHGGPGHLIFNMIFFFAVAFSLEDLWGRNVFLAFYLLAAAASCIPLIISPINIPALGASGAISATMGAFLVRLYRTKIKLFWVSIPLAIPMLAFGKKPYGVVEIAAYVFLPFYFTSQLLYWWWSLKIDSTPTVGYSVHVAGFLFGVVFAGIMSLTKLEHDHINQKIEAKVTFAASQTVSEALEAFDKGEIAIAERKLKAHITAYPEDINCILALIQVYQRMLNYSQLNMMYGRLIKHHMAAGDMEAALYAYDGLLSCFPDNHVDVRIPIKDWLAICDYLNESRMYREAAVEYERLSTAYPDDGAAVPACVQGGEAALLTHDNARAERLFKKASSMAPPLHLMARIEAGLDKCRLRNTGKLTFVKETPKPPPITKSLDDGKFPW